MFILIKTVLRIIIFVDYDDGVKVFRTTTAIIAAV